MRSPRIRHPLTPATGRAGCPQPTVEPIDIRTSFDERTAEDSHPTLNQAPPSAFAALTLSVRSHVHSLHDADIAVLEGGLAVAEI